MSPLEIAFKLVILQLTVTIVLMGTPKTPIKNKQNSSKISTTASTNTSIFKNFLNIDANNKTTIPYYYKEIQECRKKYLNKDITEFRLLLYLKITGKGQNDLKYCSFSKDTTDLQNLLSYEVYSKNKTKREIHTTNDKQTNFQIYENDNMKNNLELKLGDAWIENKRESFHTSNIYVGSSVYPLFTEKYRMIRKHNVRKPTTPKYEGKDDLPHGNKTSDKV